MKASAWRTRVVGGGRADVSRVYLVGAGPGRPDLLTLRGAECLRRADVVVMDALVDRRVLSHCRPGTKIIEAGKRGGARPRLSQPAINRTLVRWVARGKTVVRLKGGDPYFFGRGAEEARMLADRDIPFEVVPGVSSATAVPGLAGIPLTSRGHASMVTVVTGHEGEENPYLGESSLTAQRRRGPGVEWERLSPKGTLVILMGLRQFPRIAARLAALGWSADIPAAAVQWGSWPEQKTLRATLGTLAGRMTRERLGAPAVIVVGAVAGVDPAINWFERRPLFGKTALVTRAREQASSLSALLEERGARVMESPTIEIKPLPEGPREKTMVRRLGTYDGLLATSANGARVLAKKIKGRRLPPVYAVGEKTAAALREGGIFVAGVAEAFRSEGLVKILGRRVSGKAFVLARAREGRDVIERALRRRGATVDLWPLYETRPVPLTKEARQALLDGSVDAVTFTSSTTATSFMKNFTPRQRSKIFSTTRAFCIGPITGRTLRAAGVRPHVAPGNATVETLAETMARVMGRATPASPSKSNK